MKNVKMKVEGNILKIEVDLSKRHGASSSGKSKIVATTAGNVETGKKGIKMGLNVYEVIDNGKAKGEEG